MSADLGNQSSSCACWRGVHGAVQACQHLWAEQHWCLGCQIRTHWSASIQWRASWASEPELLERVGIADLKINVCKGDEASDFVLQHLGWDM